MNNLRRYELLCQNRPGLYAQLQNMGHDGLYDPYDAYDYDDDDWDFDFDWEYDDDPKHEPELWTDTSLWSDDAQRGAWEQVRIEAGEQDEPIRRI